MVEPGILIMCILVPLLGSFLLPLLGRISAATRNVAAQESGFHHSFWWVEART